MSSSKHQHQQQKKAIVFIAQGTEEMEAVITIDVLRRAGIHVLVLAVTDESTSDNNSSAGGPTKCSRGVNIVADASLGDDSVKINTYDAVIIPGGVGGAAILSQNVQVKCILAEFFAQKKIVAAICAGSLAIKSAGIQSKAPQPLQITSHPSVKDQLESEFAYREERVVVDGNLVTSRGPGSTFEFALRLVALLAGDDKAREVAGPMMLNFSV